MTSGDSLLNRRKNKLTARKIPNSRTIPKAVEIRPQRTRRSSSKCYNRSGKANNTTILVNEIHSPIRTRTITTDQGTMKNGIINPSRNFDTYGTFARTAVIHKATGTVEISLILKKNDKHVILRANFNILNGKRIRNWIVFQLVSNGNIHLAGFTTISSRNYEPNLIQSLNRHRRFWIDGSGRDPIAVIQSQRTERHSHVEIHDDRERLWRRCRANQIGHLEVHPGIECGGVRAHKAWKFASRRNTSRGREILRALKHRARIELPNRAELSSVVVSRGQIGAHATHLLGRNVNRIAIRDRNAIPVNSRGKGICVGNILRTRRGNSGNKLKLSTHARHAVLVIHIRVLQELWVVPQGLKDRERAETRRVGSREGRGSIGNGDSRVGLASGDRHLLDLAQMEGLPGKVGATEFRASLEHGHASPAAEPPEGAPYSTPGRVAPIAPRNHRGVGWPQGGAVGPSAQVILGLGTRPRSGPHPTLYGLGEGERSRGSPSRRPSGGRGRRGGGRRVEPGLVEIRVRTGVRFDRTRNVRGSAPRWGCRVGPGSAEDRSVGRLKGVRMGGLSPRGHKGITRAATPLDELVRFWLPVG